VILVIIEATGTISKSLRQYLMMMMMMIIIIIIIIMIMNLIISRWPGISVGIATDYGLDGPGIQSRWGRDFSHTSRPVLGLTRSLVQWIPDLSRGVKRPELGADHPPLPSAEVENE
jgi:hypothetical protein